MEGRRTVFRAHFGAREADRLERGGLAEERVRGGAVGADRVGGVHREAREHPVAHVLRDVAAEEPGASGIGDEVGDFHRGREEFERAGAPTRFGDAGAGPRGRVEIALRAEAEEIPAHAFAGVGREGGEVTEHATVERGARAVGERLLDFLPRHRRRGGAGESGVFGGFARGRVEPAFVEDHEERGEFAVHLGGCAVGAGAGRIGDDNRADEAEVGFFFTGDMAVVEPAARTGLGR